MKKQKKFIPFNESTPVTETQIFHSFTPVSENQVVAKYYYFSWNKFIETVTTLHHIPPADIEQIEFGFVTVAYEDSWCLEYIRRIIMNIKWPFYMEGVHVLRFIAQNQRIYKMYKTYTLTKSGAINGNGESLHSDQGRN